MLHNLNQIKISKTNLNHKNTNKEVFKLFFYHFIN